jgi:hypothetical protein
VFELFRRPEGASFPKYEPPGWPYVKGLILANLIKVKRFYRLNPTAVPSNHILVRLLQSSAIPQHMDLNRYYDNVQGLSLNLSAALFFTSSAHEGKLTHGNFYNGPEILLADFSDFDYVSEDKNWQDTQAVQVEYHPYTDLNLILPEKIRYPETKGVSVIRINIAKLLVQYRAFRLQEEQIAEITGLEQRSIYHFIRMYVLPNMLDTHLDYAVINRLNCLMDGIEIEPTKWKHSFYLNDVSAKVDQCLQYEVDFYGKVSRDLRTLVNTIKLFGKDYLIDLVEIPDMALTYQVTWALVLMRLPTVDLITRICPTTANSTNRAFTNSLFKMVTVLRTNKSLINHLPFEARIDTETLCDRILSRLGHK